MKEIAAGKEILPGWEVVRKIGTGSYGRVYEVKKSGEFGEVEHSAIKVISIPQSPDEIKMYRDDDYDDERITAMFRDQAEDITKEFKTMSVLKGNSHVVSYEDHEIVQHDDGIGWDIYIRMELLTSLPDYYKNQSIPEEDVIKLGMDMCKALALCQKHNIIHRDIKPQNIFLNSNGDYKLGDFGIAKTSDHTTSGTKVGTVPYMAPEVYKAQPYNASVDIYSLGLVLYWCLNEKRGPFLTATPKGQQQQVAQERRMAGEQLPEPKHGGAALKSVVLKACAYKSEDRYASPQEMLEALQATIDGTTGSKLAEDKNRDYTEQVRPPKPEITSESELPQEEEVCPEDKTYGRNHRPEPKPTPPPNKKPIKRWAVPLAVAIAVAFVAVLLSRFHTNDSSKDESAAASVQEVVSVTVAPVEEATAETSTESEEASEEAADSLESNGTYEQDGDADNQEDNVLTAPDAPENLTVVAYDANSVSISWTGSAGAQWYEVQYYGHDSEKWLDDPDYESGTEYVSTGLLDYDSHQFRVRAVNAAGCSEWVACVYMSADADVLNSGTDLLPEIQAMEASAVGDIITFGTYEQDNDVSDGMEPIQWRVLAQEGDRLLLIAEYALDVQPYNETLESTTWAECTLRSWLNNQFLNTAFTSEEQAYILESSITNADNREFGTEGGEDTVDRVFLLSMDEAEAYFSSDADRLLTATEYSRQKNVYTNSDSDSIGYGRSTWWLRSPGISSDSGAYVKSTGEVLRENQVYNAVNSGDIAVRPAIWITRSTG